MRGSIALLALVACTQPQWTVFLSTDAPVPQLGDRLLVEVLDASGMPACGSGCQRIVGAGDISNWPVSFGVAPDVGAALYVRARLYRADHATFDGLPVAAYIDALGRLPLLDGVVHVGLPLSLECFAVPASVTDGSACDPASGAPAAIATLTSFDAARALRPGTWNPALAVDCPSAPPDGMACVPGGAFVLGGVRGFALDVPAVPERLVVLSPFALDKDEMKVKDLVPLVQRGLPPPLTRDPDSMQLGGACTWQGAAADATSETPVNCISLDAAARACAMSGKRLPSEAEWEFAAGNLGLETDYPWGDGDPCLFSVTARGRTQLEFPALSNLEQTTCRTAIPDRVLPWGPAGGGAATDQTLLGIFNLGGNVHEWVDDAFFPYGAPCWTPAGTTRLQDPHCPSAVGAVDPSLRPTLRGGSWASYSFETHATHRGQAVSAQPTVENGFRCAKSF